MSSTLYPEIAANTTHSLDVGDGHTLYIEESGNPKGLPVVFLHGGPGAGCEPYHRRFFNPDSYRIILFDQRGCGRSKPHASLKANTTQHLIADIETIRAMLGIDQWLVFGGSWGSTLALVYAETHPDRVLALVLRGIFLCRPREIDWFYREGASRIFPDHWHDYISVLSEEERAEPVSSYYARLTSDDEITRLAAAKAWSQWEGRCATLHGEQAVIDHFVDTHTALSLARVECHYFVNDSFLKENHILDNTDSLGSIAGTIVHGRYDMVCPIESAWSLHKAWPQADLKIIQDAGHSATEPGIVSALVEACDRYGDQFGAQS